MLKKAIFLLAVIRSRGGGSGGRIRQGPGQDRAQDRVRCRGLMSMASRQASNPILKKKGYTVRYFEFSTGLEANTAVFKNDIDANVMQHTVFLNSYNDRQKTDLVGIVQVPTPPMGLYSKKHAKGEAVKPGTSVAVAERSGQSQRALWILRDLGWIEIRDSKPVDVTELDVNKNPSGIKIVPLENAQAPRVLPDVDYAAIQGNFAIYSGLKLTEAIALEKMGPPYINVVAVPER